jgi:hypothetical protein
MINDCKVVANKKLNKERKPVWYLEYSLKKMHKRISWEWKAQ